MFKTINNVDVGLITCDICGLILKNPALKDQSKSLDLCKSCEIEVKRKTRSSCSTCGGKYKIDVDNRKVVCENRNCKEG